MYISCGDCQPRIGPQCFKETLISFNYAYRPTVLPHLLLYPHVPINETYSWLCIIIQNTQKLLFTNIALMFSYFVGCLHLMYGNSSLMLPLCCYMSMSILTQMYCFLAVATTAGQLCGRHKPLQVTSSVVYLSSTVADETGFGTNICPWSVKVRPGQQVKLTLYNFIHSTPSSGTRQGRFCETYVTVTEGGKSSNKTSCVGDSREKYLLTSKSNTIQVGILPAMRQMQEARRFLVKFEGE